MAANIVNIINPKFPCNISSINPPNIINLIMPVTNPKKANVLCRRNQFFGLWKATTEIEAEKKLLR